MNIKRYLLLSSFTNAVLLSAAPLVSIGDHVDVFFDGSSNLRWTSNVFQDEDQEVDDVIFTVSPGFELNVGRGLSNAELNIITSYDILTYDERSDLDTETFHIRAVGVYESSRLDLNGTVSFDERQSSISNGDSVKGELIESEDTGASLNGEYSVSPKFSFGAGVRYSDQKYTSHEQLADRESITIPLDAFYELTPKVDLSMGYTYTGTEIGETRSLLNPGPGERVVSGYDRVNHFFNVGARGELLPKMSGFFKVGYRTMSSDDSTVSVASVPAAPRTRSDRGSLGLDADLTWTATPKLIARLGLSRDFGVGGEGNVTAVSSADMSIRYSINTYLAASANMGYTLREYQDASSREDNQYIGGLRLSYTPDQYWRFSTGYTHSENDSSAIGRNYSSDTIDFTAALRY
jgi:hypothetical protein